MRGYYQDRTRCPLKDNCLMDNAIYKATVKKEEHNNDEKSYISTTEISWENEWSNHKL